MALPLFDLHCDTLYEANKQNLSLKNNGLHISFDRLSAYKPFCQVMAVWSHPDLSDSETWAHFHKLHGLLTTELSKVGNIRLVHNAAELSECEKNGVGTVMLAVEGGRLIEKDLDRINLLYDMGVRFMTLTWDDPCPICGSNKLGGGVTDFGFSALSRMTEVGIIPDISHASHEAACNVIDFCRDKGTVCIATHSNSYTVTNHRRNLSDSNFSAISQLGGVVGISLYRHHLSTFGNADTDSVLRHIDHYMSLGGENTVCLGCDLDGIDYMPEGMKTVSDLYKIADALGRNNYTDSLIEKIFYANARNFVSLWIK